MVLIDGMPLVSGLSSVYGLSGIPQSLIKQIEVIKGPASTLFGSEAIGGVINLITKVPENVNQFNIESYMTSWGELNIDLGTKYKLNNATGLIGVNYFNYSNPIDNNRDGFTDLTLQHRVSFFNKIKLKKNSLAFRYFYENRWGGEMGWNSSYRGGKEVYGESIYTSRIEAFGKYDISQNLFIQYSLNNHDQNSVYGFTSYNALQTIGFIQGVYSKKIKNHNLLFGPLSGIQATTTIPLRQQKKRSHHYPEFSFRTSGILVNLKCYSPELDMTKTQFMVTSGLLD